jgi:hypothetical protein
MRDAVTDYAGELGTALRVSGRRRRWIVAEACDHLAELIACERERGAGPEQAAERAVRRFGAPDELDLRHHPWRAAATASIAAGLALKAPDLLAGGPDLLDAAFEAAAAYACFAVLGGLLGLRGARPRDARSRVEYVTTG